MEREIICKIENITKEFPGTKALDQVSFDIAKEKFMRLLVRMVLESLP